MGENKEIETEIKLRIDALPPWQARLESVGFELLKAHAPEVSVLFDRQGELYAANSALRLRSYHNQCTLTYKGPKILDPLLKIRPEFETKVEDQAQMEAILLALGYQPILKMTKSRTLMGWTAPSGENVTACLDEAPFGLFMELEGSREILGVLISQLQINTADVETRSYPRLFREHGLG